ncbi:hypothetical protein ABBQ32_005750 [Trebouxia sp. C0010 RCD-2024]
MNQQRGSEARLEVALAQAIINEVKYGSETNQLAEVSLLAAFHNRVVGEKLAHALLVLMPGLQYFSVGALLKDGVTVCTSNLVIPGPIDISARSLRGTAARIAARKNSTLHVKRRAGDASASKYFELQEVWEQVGATSVLSIPIPAVRNYESASIVEAPAPVEEPCDSTSNASHVLHNTNGAIGIVTVGLATEKIDLNGRQGKALQAMAQSLSPFLAYYAASALEELHSDICNVANANAALIAKFRARQQQAEQRRPPLENDTESAPNKDGSADGQMRAGGAGVLSPFSAVSDPESKCHPAGLPAKAAAPPRPAESTGTGGAAQHGHNLFAQAATISFSESTSVPASVNCAKPEHQKQPVSPFATAAEESGRTFDTCVRPELAQASSADQSAMPRPEAHSHGACSGSQSENGGAINPASIHIASSSGEMASDDAHQVEQNERGYTLDTPFVFKRKPVSSAHVRRYSTSTFFQGVLHTPKGHLSHLSNLSTMVAVPEDSAPEEQPSRQQTVFVDDYSYASVAQQVSRRAYSTPSASHHAGGLLDLSEALGHLQALGSCPGPFLGEGPSSDMQVPDAKGSVAAAKAHLALLGKVNEAGAGRGVMAEGASGAGMVSPANMSVPWLIEQPGTPSSVHEAQAEIEVSHVENRDFEMNSPLKQGDKKKGDAPSRDLSSAVHQHPLWLTFLDSDMEEQFGVWMGQRCSKVDTIFMLAATVYITQLLFYTWALADQQAKKWPLLGYTMLPVLLLQHGDTAWYLKNRSTIVTIVRCVLLVFLTCLVPAIIEGSEAPPSRWIDSSGLWPLVVISLGLLVSQQFGIWLKIVVVM